MKRSAAISAALLVTLAGCARPSAQAAAKPSPTAATQVMVCVYQPPAPSPTRRTPSSFNPPPLSPTHRRSGTPTATASRTQTPDEAWAQRVAENHAYRQRHALPAAAVADARPYAQAVCEGLKKLRDVRRYDAIAIQHVLANAKLDEVQVRPPGPYDGGGDDPGSSGDALLLAGWTGQACLIGVHGPSNTVVSIRSQIADGGCLPAGS